MTEEETGFSERKILPIYMKRVTLLTSVLYSRNLFELRIVEKIKMHRRTVQEALFGKYILGLKLV